MNSFRFKLQMRTCITVVSCLVAFGCSSVCLADSTETASATAEPTKSVPAKAIGEKPSRAQLQQFRTDIQKLIPPAKPGKDHCYTANFPSTHLTETTCVAAPKSPNPRRKSSTSPHPEIVGNGVDGFAVVSQGSSIVRSTGWFDEVDVKSESGPRPGTNNKYYPDTYMLQINSNDFASPACKGIQGCFGWEQFFYSTSACSSTKACIYIEYWLFNYPKPCPNGYHYYPGDPGDAGCFFNTSATLLPRQTWAELRDISIQGAAGTSDDDVTVTTSSGQVATVHHASSLTLNGNWRGIEFNLVGDCCGTEAVFSDGRSTLQLRIDAETGSQAALSCQSSFSGATGETNNLDITVPCFATASGVGFTEAGGTPAPPPPAQLPCAQLKTNIAELEAKIEKEQANPPACPSGIVAICTQQLRGDEAGLAQMKADYSKRCH